MSKTREYQFSRCNATKEQYASGYLRCVGVDFMGPFPMLEKCEYILVAADYVSKWVEALYCVAADSKSSKKMFQKIIFPRFGVLRVMISDGGSHFIDRTFRKCLSELGVDHRVATPYHPQTSGQAETSNKQSRTFCKRRSMPWGRAGKANYPRHYGLIERLTKCQLV